MCVLFSSSLFPGSLIVCVDLHVVPYLNGLVKLPYAIKTRKSVINFMHVNHLLLAVDIRR